MGSLFPVVQKAIASVEPVEMHEIAKIHIRVHCQLNRVRSSLCMLMVLPSVIDNNLYLHKQTNAKNSFLSVFTSFQN